MDVCPSERRLPQTVPFCPVTVEDVVASINYHRKEDFTSAAKPLVEAISDGEAVAFQLDSGNADFQEVFLDYQLPILLVTEDGINWKSGNGCGPYKPVDFQPSVSAIFTRNENDLHQNRGWFTDDEMLAVVDLSARTNTLVSGDMDATDRLDLKAVRRLAGDPNIQFILSRAPNSFAISCNKAPYSDENVRRALRHTINGGELVEKILFGFSKLGNDRLIGAGQRFFNADLAQTAYDPDKAEFYLIGAGLDGLTVQLSSAEAAFGGAVVAAVLYQNLAASVGITVEVNRVPNDGYWSDVWMLNSFFAVYWSGRVTEDSMFTLAYSDGTA